MANSSTLPRTIAIVRIATSSFFLLFGEYKVASPAFAHGGYRAARHNDVCNYDGSWTEYGSLVGLTGGAPVGR